MIQHPTISAPRHYDKYVRNVLQCDIARSSLCILLHGLADKEYPALYPVDIGRLPLTWLAILCDELQEFLRPEGIDRRLVVQCVGWPDVIEASFDESSRTFTLRVQLSGDPPAEPKDLRALLKQRQAFLRKESKEGKSVNWPYGMESVKDWGTINPRRLTDIYKSYLSILWSDRKELLYRRLSFGPDPDRGVTSGYSARFSIQVVGRGWTDTWELP
jgi:hypothetical protein